MILYKYREDSENTTKIFTTKKVWLSTAVGLNDPFECDIQIINMDLHRAQVSQIKESRLGGFLHSANSSIKTGHPFFGLSKKEIRTILGQFKNLKNLDKAYAKFQYFMKQKTGNSPTDPEQMFLSVQEQLSAVGIFSLSQVPDDPLMWAHYAKDHKGICLGFEITDDSVLADVERCLHVEYTNSTPKISEQLKSELTISFDEKGALRTESRLAFSDPSLRAAISTKGPEWEYEKEWRYVEPIAGAYDWPAPIVEITFGVRCPQERRDFYINLAQSSIPNEVRIYEIIKIPNTKSFKRLRLQQNSVASSLPALNANIEEVQRLLEQRQYTSALNLIENLMKSGKESAELWRCKGIALGWSENHDEALKCFESAINLDHDFFSAWYQKGVSLTMLERYDEAIAANLRAQELCSNEPSVAFNLGTILAHSHRYDEAIAQLETAVKLGHPRASDTLKLLRSPRAPS